MRIKTTRRKPKPAPNAAPARVPEVVHIGAAARFLTVSPNTVYILFKIGELLARAVERGDWDALAEALNTGKARLSTNGVP
jgi:hypothetical protein